MSQPLRAPEGLLSGNLDPGSLRVPEDSDRRRPAEVPVQDYEAHLAACTRKVNRTGYSRSWDSRLSAAIQKWVAIVVEDPMSFDRLGLRAVPTPRDSP